MSTSVVTEQEQGLDSPIGQPNVAHYALEVEQSLLGGLMLDCKVWDDIVGKIQEDDFYHPRHRLIFRSMSCLVKQTEVFDVVTLLDALKSANELDRAGGETYLFELANNTPGVANIVAYANLIRDKSVLRQLITTANEIANSARTDSEKSVYELLDVAESKIFKIAQQAVQGGPEGIGDILSRTIDRIDHLYRSGEAITGLPTGFSDLDAMTSGLQASDLIILAGRPSMGKTALAMNIAEHAAIKGNQPVLIFSLEMPSDSLAVRLLSSLGRVDQHRLRTGKLTDEDWSRITSSIHLLSGASLLIDDSPGLTPGEIRGRARRVTKEYGQLGVIIIDYLQLMRVPGFRVDNRTAEISEVSRTLKTLAKELNVPVIALSQLNRSLEQRADRRPVMSDLRESGAIEQDADLIIFIYRDEVYNRDSSDKGKAEIIISKHRNGPIGMVKLTFLKEFAKFEDLAYEGYQNLSQT